jgi:3-dehydroquinate dehydratase type I
MIEEHTNIAELMDQVSAKKPDLLEVRLDKIQDNKVIDELATRRSFPLIATDKPDRGTPSRLEKLAYAASTGFEFVDLDYPTTNAAIVTQMKSNGAEVILSFHDHARTPPEEELIEIMEAEKRLGGDICKVVTTARVPRDSLTVLDFVQHEAQNARLVSFAMGEHGVPSRILSPWFGAEFTFASLSSQSRTGEGQPTIDELRSAWAIFGLQ